MSTVFIKHIAVLAGSKTEFKEWLAKQEHDDNTHYRYVYPGRDWVGYIFDDYKIVGSYWQSVDKACSFYRHIIVRLRP